MFQINWKLKSLVYKFLEFFRLKRTLYFIQKKITKRSNINLNEIIFYWDFHLKYLTNNNSTKILEFGAGKSLIQNIFLSYKTNLKFEQTLIDISKMIDLDLFNRANEQVAKILKVERRPFVKNNNDIKKNFNILYSAPTALNEIEEKNLLFDACISSTVLEHFPIKDLEETFTISASIDYSDHYSHTDKKISKLNFLQFSDEIWSKYNNSFLFQNRLRHQDYKKIFINLDYEIIDEIKGDYEKKPKLISNNFDVNNKDTFMLWGHFLLKFKK
jgi:hypothetical protein